MLRLSELVRSYETHTGEIEVVGWIKTARESKNVGFIELGDGSCFKNVQVVYETNNINPNITKQLNTGTAIGVKGELVLTPEMQQQERDELLSTTAEDIRAYAPMLRAFGESRNVCVIGSGDSINAEKELFESIINLK